MGLIDALTGKTTIASCCGTNFKTQEDFVEHRETVHGERRAETFSCCGQIFSTKAEHLAHMARVHGK
ncbi:MAG: hypothetical protein HY556_03065 [Euryarchaeota archaeon]|nr:hypothetical protein [Euryarchaeota archaeon]